MSRLFTLAILSAFGAGCGAVLAEPFPDEAPPDRSGPDASTRPREGVVCGPGTVERDRQCVVAPSDGDGDGDDDGGGTVDPPDEDDAGAMDAGEPEDAAPADDAGIDAGSPADAGPDASAIDAGPPPLTCGPGTREVEGVCLPVEASGIYEVRTNVTTINADGYTKIPLVAFGRTAQGAPSSEPVVFSITRPGVATLTPALTTLLPMGRAVQLVPCRASSSPACVGPVQVTMALASNPLQIVATSPVLQLVEPAGIGSAAACLVGGNVLHLDGDAGDYIHPGATTYTTGSWTWSLPEPALDTFTLSYRGAGSIWWNVTMTSRGLGEALAETVYRDAKRHPFEGAGLPGLSISGSGRGCNQLVGNFQILEQALDASGELESVTATFEQRCDNSPGWLRGCVHVER